MATGGYGRIGSRLCERLLNAGYDVSSPTRDELYLGSMGAVRQWICATEPRRIVHLAGMTNVDECQREPRLAYRENVEVTQILAELCGEFRLPMVFASTDYVFEGTENRPMNESDEPSPIQTYGGTKLEAELIVRKFVPESIIVRLQSIYCFGGKTFVDFIADNQKRGVTTRAVTDQAVCPTRADDAADAILALITDDAPPGIYHASSKDSCSWHEFATEMIRRSFYDPKLLEPVTRKDLNRPALRPKYTVFDCAKIMRATKWIAPAWKDALEAEINMPHDEEMKVGLTA